MKIDDYLARIEYHGPTTPDLACLAAIHRQHLLQIAYENLDVQLERPLDFDIERIFDRSFVGVEGVVLRDEWPARLGTRGAWL